LTNTGRLQFRNRFFATLAAALLAWPAAAQAPELAMLGTLEKGAWTLRFRDEGGQQRVCLRDGREFIQLRHRMPGCSRFVVNDGPDEVAVQYTCRGSGYGLTTVRRESRSLVQIETRGIVNGTPFSQAAEARHTGRC
jgi:hypothetical protein